MAQATVKEGDTMEKKEGDIDFDIVLKKNAKDSINLLPDDIGDDDIDSVWDSLVNDVKGEIGNGIEIVEDVKFVDKPITKPEDCTTSKVLAKMDVEFKELMARNVVTENALMIVMSAFEKIMSGRGITPGMINKLKELREISIKKDKLSAIQKYDAIASEINDSPGNEANALLMAILYVYYEIFFARVDF
jgi:RNAse (barnase) inhibitor barstar